MSPNLPESARIGAISARIEAVVTPLLLAHREGKRPLLVAIDGRCGAGKSTLAAELSRRRGWGVVHLDDFFPRPEQRTPERYAQPGGNLDWERVLEQVLTPLRAGKTARYQAFDCHAGALGAWVEVPAGEVVLVEGSYACHPELWGVYDLKIFLTVGPEEQARRILARNGPERAEVFRTRWIPLEEAYFSAYSIAERCDLTLET